MTMMYPGSIWNFALFTANGLGLGFADNNLLLFCWRIWSQKIRDNKRALNCTICDISVTLPAKPHQ